MKKVIKRIVKPVVFKYLKNRGVVEFRRQRLLDDLFEDLFEYKATSIKEKVWCYRRGFISDKMIRYKLNKDNYKDYISDIDFYREANYVNRGLGRMFDDKLAFFYFARDFRKHMPKHHFLVYQKKIVSLDNFEEGSVLLLLKKGNTLAMKPVFGRHGEGFYRISLVSGKTKINNKVISEKETDSFVKSLQNYIVTDYVDNHPTLKQASPHSSMVFRIATIFDKELGPGILGACARFQRTTDNIIVDQPGGIQCGVDIETGGFFRPMLIIKGEFAQESNSKDQYELPDNAPYFDKMKEISLEVADAFQATPYLTFDYIIDATGPKIIEMGSHGMPRALQQFYPYRQNTRANKLFTFTT